MEADDAPFTTFQHQLINRFNEFVTTPGIVPSTLLNSSRRVMEIDRFNELLAPMMDSLAIRAASSEPGRKKFATEEGKFTSSETVNGMVQCTPDLSAAGCDMCLLSAIAEFPLCCNGKDGGTALLPSCIARYELFPFCNNTETEPLPSPPGRRKSGIIFM